MHISRPVIELYKIEYIRGISNEKIIYTIILILAIITGIVLVTGKIATDKHQKKNVQTKIEEIDKLPIKLEDMGDVEFKLYKIPENVAEYIKTKSEFSSI